MHIISALMTASQLKLKQPTQGKISLLTQIQRTEGLEEWWEEYLKAIVESRSWILVVHSELEEGNQPRLVSCVQEFTKLYEPLYVMTLEVRSV